MIPKSNCLKCNNILWDPNPKRQPEKGSYALCMYCGNVAVFDKNLKLKSPKKIPLDVALKSELIKRAIEDGINMEQIVKDILINSGHVKEN